METGIKTAPSQRGCYWSWPDALGPFLGIGVREGGRGGGGGGGGGECRGSGEGRQKRV